MFNVLAYLSEVESEELKIKDLWEVLLKFQERREIVGELT